MLVKNHLVRWRIAIGESGLLTLYSGARVRFSFLASSENWVVHNELFQRHPKLQVIEQKWKKSFSHLRQILSYVIVSGLHRNAFVMSRLLFLSLVDLGEGDERKKSEFGVQIFHRIENPNVFSWNTMFRFFAGFCPATAVDYYVEMLREGKFPDSYSFPFLLQACQVCPDLGFVKQIHCQALKLFSGYNLFIQNSLLHAYLICNSVTDAQIVFDELPQKDIVSWTTVISWLVSQSNYNGALRSFREMMTDGLQTRPNDAAIVSIMSACGGLGSILLTKCLHALLEKAGWLEFDISIVNSLTDTYAKCGDLDCARQVFNETSNMNRDLYSWTAIISGYAMHGQGIEALNIFIQLKQNSGFHPDEVSYYAILSACAHSGLVNEGLSIFESMIVNSTINPDHKHYGCIIDLLGKAGMLEKAFDILEKMPMQPNFPILGSLLSNCRVHNNLKMSKNVLAKIESLNLNVKFGASQVLLSNIYATENQWSKVERIRNEMRQQLWVKPAGRSWIQIKDEIFEFVARNEFSDSESMELSNVLQSLERLSRFY